jgi:hypothetical protein
LAKTIQLRTVSIDHLLDSLQLSLDALPLLPLLKNLLIPLLHLSLEMFSLGDFFPPLGNGFLVTFDYFLLILVERVDGFLGLFELVGGLYKSSLSLGVESAHLIDHFRLLSSESLLLGLDLIHLFGMALLLRLQLQIEMLDGNVLLHYLSLLRGDDLRLSLCLALQSAHLFLQLFIPQLHPT